MRRQAAVRSGWLVLAAGLLHSALTAYACGDLESGVKSVGEPCTRTSECVTGLVCAGGVCRQGDAGLPLDGGQPARDASVEDASLEDASLEDAGDAPAEADASIEDASTEDAAPDSA